MSEKYGTDRVRVEEGTNSEAGESAVTASPGGPDALKAAKLRQRQERIRQWKLKKEQEEGVVAAASAAGTAGATSAVETDEARKLSRQQKLEEWKRKKAAPSEAALPRRAAGAGATPMLRLGPAVRSVRPKVAVATVAVKRASVFAADDDQPVRKKMPQFGDSKSEEGGRDREAARGAGHGATGVGKGPSIGARDGAVQDGYGDEDDLEAYMARLQREEAAATAAERSVLLRTTSEAAAGEAPFRDGDGADGADGADASDSGDDDAEDALTARIEKLQQREKVLAAVDHTLVAYQPFRRNFYREPAELAQLLPEDVDTERLLLDGIKVRGRDCPRPVLRWGQLALPAAMAEVVQSAYAAPLPIQAQALPAILQGRDVIGVAQTGSGKTLAFVLPMMRHVLGQEAPVAPREAEDEASKGPMAVVMTPTRELALQIGREAARFAAPLGVRVSCCYGGAPIQLQIAELKRGVEVMVGTPGRIIDLLAANGGRVTNLRRVTYLVLDEADRMFDMGFEPQVMRVFGQVRPDRQTVLFLATFPRRMEVLARLILQEPVEIVVGGRSVVAAEITQRVELLGAEDKLSALVPLLDEFLPGKVLIFVEKQTSCDELLVQLLRRHYACLAIHGGKDQLDRKHAIREFSLPKSGVNVLIATSIAARGLDVKGLALVVNYDAPSHMEDYVHRVGRTGRAGMRGTAVTFVLPSQERAITDLVRALRLSKVPEAEISLRLREISDAFLRKVKQGKEKYNFGFGGKGLDKLQEVRDVKQQTERRQYGEDGSAGTTKAASVPAAGAPTNGVAFPDFEIVEGCAPETAGPDKGKYHARIAVNDLPQTARWNMMSRESLSKIIEATSTSITNKGQFYARGASVPPPTVKNGRPVEAPPKLYLLVEGLTEAAVKDAIAMLRVKMVEGLESAVKDEARGPSGRYKV